MQNSAFFNPGTRSEITGKKKKIRKDKCCLSTTTMVHFSHVKQMTRIASESRTMY
jgi:hypothetical protein